MESISFCSKNSFLKPNSSFFISFIFWSAEIQFQPFYFQSTRVLRVRKLRSLTYFVTGQKSFEIFHNIKFVSRIKQLLTHLFQIQPFSALWNGLSNFEYWNVNLIAYKKRVWCFIGQLFVWCCFKMLKCIQRQLQNPVRHLRLIRLVKIVNDL